MRSQLYIMLVGFLLVVASERSTWAAPADDAYLAILAKIQEADRLLSAGEADPARRLYSAQLDALRAFAQEYPAWHPDVVGFRLRYLQGRSTLSDSPTGGLSATNEVVAGLQRRISQLEGENALLQARLREALGGRPAVLDPDALARAESQIRDQRKEIDLLKIQVAKHEEGPDAAAMTALKQALAELRRELSRERLRTGQLAARLADLQSASPASTPARDRQGASTVSPPTEAASADPTGIGVAGQATAVLEGLAQTVERSPNDVDAHLELAKALIDRGLPEAAESLLLRAVEAAGADPRPHLALARLYVSREPSDLTLARWHYSKAVEGGAVRDTALERSLGVP